MSSSNTNLLVNLGLYFAINLSLSTCNKFVLNAFPYPWLVTSLHAIFTSIGCLIFLMRGYFEPAKLTRHENLVLIAFSSLFTVNIAISNVSLSLVSLPFHQVVRSTTPIFAVLIYRVMYSQSFTTPIYLSLVVMTVGIAAATFGDYYFTMMGFCLTVLGVVLAAVKTVATNRLMTGTLKLHPLDILLRMCPLAAVQSLICAGFSGEITGVTQQYTEFSTLWQSLGWLLAVNGMLAFAQNVSSFHTNKVAGALTLTVCANVKQVMTIILAIATFHTEVGLLNGVGMAIAVGGSAWYSWIKLAEKQQRDTSMKLPQ